MIWVIRASVFRSNDLDCLAGGHWGPSGSSGSDRRRVHPPGHWAVGVSASFLEHDGDQDFNHFEVETPMCESSGKVDEPIKDKQAAQKEVKCKEKEEKVLVSPNKPLPSAET